MIKGTFLILIVVSFLARLSQADERPLLSTTADAKILSIPGSNGDRVPDFSVCGFEASNVGLPRVKATRILQPSGGDDTLAIQQALDQVARQTAVESTTEGHRWRGAVLLAPGVFRVSQTLYLRGDHVVLRGSGAGDLETTLLLTSSSRRPGIVVGSDGYDLPRNGFNRKPEPTKASGVSTDVIDYVATGATRIKLSNAAGFAVGQCVEIIHPSTPQWIEALGMKSFPDDDGKGSWLNWKPNTMDQVWRRRIREIEGHALILDAPITSSIDPKLTRGLVRVASPTPHHHLGIEKIRIISRADVSSNPMDEEHAWDGIRFCNVSDAWAREIRFEQFVGSAVHISQDANRITISDCQAASPISELAGWRRHTYFCLGQQSLFLRCTAEDGRHDFSTGPLTSGPNAFVYCTAKNSSQFSGPIGSWSTGVLYDNVEIDGSSIQLTNRETEMAGTGWAAANCVLWNCIAPQIVCRQPSTGFNAAVGVWGEVLGNGNWRSLNEFVSPESLFAAQLSERIGISQSLEVLSKPSPDDFDSGVSEPESLTDSGQIGLRSQSDPTSRTSARDSSGGHTKLAIVNGWLTMGDRLATGKRHSMAWWRGSLLSARAAEFGLSLTRYAPGLDGPFHTNSVEQLVEEMERQGSIALEHHWGLWYDRRRDDHQMVRRMNGDAWPPFYEQPWARSGSGKAWDGLSKYDLSRFNSWYFDRLSQFAKLADQHGLIFIQQMYFQHNILEAGAHWADFPWRTANCLQETGFPEPPVYENRKRVFMADAFYDVSHPVRRDLHTRYIRHCLDTLGFNQNVLFQVGEEYTGPAHFVKFWLDTIRNWSSEKQRDVHVVLSACRNVQEEILSLPEYASMIDVIDLKYWWHTPEGTLYDPPGGQNLAPRQQLRSWIGTKSRSSESLGNSIRDLKSRFPTKAVICSLPVDNPWMLLAAGCSLPDLPSTCDPNLLREVVGMHPETSKPEWSLYSGNSTTESGLRLMVVKNAAIPAVAQRQRDQMMVVDTQSGKLMAVNPDSFTDEKSCVVWFVGKD